MDSATLSTQCGPERQCGASIWNCTAGFAAQNWTHGNDNTLQNTRDAGFVGAQGGAESGGTHMLKLEAGSDDYFGFPTIVSPSSKDKRAQWVAQADGTLANAFNNSLCLGTVPPPTVIGLDQYMMGDEYMAAPVLVAGARERQVHYPKGASWTHHYTGKVYEGGTTATVQAPLDSFPLFKRGDATSVSEIEM